MYRNKTLFIAVLGSLALASCEQKKAPPTAATPVNLVTVKAVPVVYYDRYEGTTVALSQVNLIPEVQGYVTGIFFKEGAHVRKGTVLYEIDKRIYEGNYQAAAANLKVAEGTLTQSQQDADRYSYLNSEKAVAKQIYDHAIITLENSKNSVKAAAESLKVAKANLAYSTITAPFDGTIGISQVKLGDMLTVGQTVLNTISTDDPMAVDFLINEKQLPHFEDLQYNQDKLTDSLFTLLLPDNSFYPHMGKLSVIDRAVSSQTGSIRVRLVFPNPKYYLRAGMSCVVRVRNQELKPQMVIPSKALVEQMGEFFVYVAKDTVIAKADSSAKKENKPEAPSLHAFEVKVQPGATIGANTVIKGGIEEGDKVVIDGVQSLHDGSKITTENKVPPTQAGKGGR